MATLITPNGVSKDGVTPKVGKSFTLEELYELVECETVEMVRLSNGDLMWLDEDGKHKSHLKENHKATDLLMKAGGSPMDYVVGTVLITTPQEGGEGVPE